MRNKLYLECTSGISGDMTVAALLDLGADQKKLVRTLKSLPVKGFDIKISRVMKSGIDACDFDVLLDHDHENHDHDMGLASTGLHQAFIQFIEGKNNISAEEDDTDGVHDHQ